MLLNHHASAAKKRKGYQCLELPESMKSPVIIVGMHRSGTTLLTRMIERMGINMGIRQGNSTSEDLFFQSRNDALLKTKNSTWDKPDAWISSIQKDTSIDKLIGFMTHQLLVCQDSPVNLMPTQNESATSPQQQWGFKDPRTSLTLPIWRFIFPKAKIIHIVRDAHDVSKSIVTRSSKQPKFWHTLRGRTPLNYQEALQLWTTYLSALENNLQGIDERQILHLKYEELCHQPKVTLSQISNFLKIGVSESTILAAANLVRKQSDTNPKPLTQLPDAVKTMMTKHGYTVKN